MQTYYEAVKWIQSLLPLGIKPGLSRMEWMLERLNHPERRLKYIHVGGTNGKGSTVNFLRHMLQESGLEVGTFTSPSIISFNDRIAVNGNFISEEDFLSVANQIRPLVDELAETSLGSPTEFEVITMIAFVYFATIAYPDVVIMEVGLGGRLDSTNVISPMVTLITNVGHDHMNILGDTKEAIAREKAGIIKSGVPLITTEEDELILDVFHEVTEGKNSKMLSLGKQFGYQDHQSNLQNQQFSFHSPFVRMENLSITMQGLHQIKNATLALMAIVYLKNFYALIVEENEIKRGLEKASWVGRFEKISEEPLVYIDGAHNKEGIEALASTVSTHFIGKKIHLLFAATVEKNVNDILESIYSLVDNITFTTFDHNRAQKAEMLFDQSSFTKKSMDTNWKDALKVKLETMDKNDVLLITGSLYFIAEVYPHYKK